VFVLQGDLVRKQDQLAAAQGDVVTSLISVYKALGGGWQIRCPGFHPRGITEFEAEAEPEEIVPPRLSTKLAQPKMTMDEEN
jgi:hypothetical protein